VRLLRVFNKEKVFYLTTDVHGRQFRIPISTTRRRESKCCSDVSGNGDAAWPPETTPYRRV